nr:PREDICTED: serine/threonine-protein phosphatase 6 regulatory subunit 3-B [Bemisia tabaci]XP_018913939.1 PREDICTED: serine/threonine-protein phosphatase 6 regulatory subunit 3-B [Bemisia tabaci]
MAYWKVNISSQADTILSKENLTLAEVLDIENVIQDAKNGNKKLLDFLYQPIILEELIDLITTEPSDELPDNEKYRHPFIACELLTTDAIVISRHIAENEHLLDNLLAFVDQKPPLNPLLASFFSRTIVSFFTRSVHQDYYMYQYVCLRVLECMKGKEGFVKQLVAHIGTSAIMELILKMVKEADNSDMQLSISSWLYSEGLITQLIETLHPDQDPVCQYNAAQLLCDMIHDFIVDVNKPNVIVDILESTNAVKLLLEIVLSHELKETSIVAGISVLLMLLPSMSSLTNSDTMDYKVSDSDPLSVMKYGDDASEKAVETQEQNKENENGNGSDASQPWYQIESIVIREIIPYLGTLHRLLQEPLSKPGFVSKTLNGPPLGNTRLRITSLLATLIVLNHQEFINELIAHNIFQTLLDLFCSYPWNNFYHTQFENCLMYALKPVNSRKSEDNSLIKYLFIDCEVIQFVLKLWDNNKASMSSENGRRQGYMGHLIEIATVINSTLKENPFLESLLNEIDPDLLIQWNHLVQDELNPTLELQKQCLSGVHPRDAQPDEEVTTSVSGKKFSGFRTESYWESNVNLEDNLSNDTDEGMFEEMCAQKLDTSWNDDVISYDDNDDDGEADADNSDDEDMEEGGVEENFGLSGDKKRKRKEKDKKGYLSFQEDKGSESKIFVNQNAPFLGGTDTEKMNFDLSFVSAYPWKQDFDDNANSGWADFESNFGSPGADGNTNTETMNGPKNDPFAVSQTLSNLSSEQPDSFFNDNDFGNFESASFDMDKDPFSFSVKVSEKKTFNTSSTPDRPFGMFSKTSEVSESDVDKIFDFMTSARSSVPDDPSECSSVYPFKEPKSTADKVNDPSEDEAFQVSESNMKQILDSSGIDLDQNENTPGLEAESAETSESNLDKTVDTSKDKDQNLNMSSSKNAGEDSATVETVSSENPEATRSDVEDVPKTPEADKTSELPNSFLGKALKTPELMMKKFFGTPECLTHKFFRTPEPSNKAPGTLDASEVPVSSVETPESSPDKKCESSDSNCGEASKSSESHSRFLEALDAMRTLRLSMGSDVVTSNAESDLNATSRAEVAERNLVINERGEGGCVDRLADAEEHPDPKAVAFKPVSEQNLGIVGNEKPVIMNSEVNPECNLDPGDKVPLATEEMASSPKPV